MYTARIYAGISVGVILLSPGAAPGDVTYNLWMGLVPTNAALVDVEAKVGGLVLATNSVGEFVTEGYIEFDISGHSTHGRRIAIDAERVNLVVDGDFESISSTNILMYNPDTGYTGTQFGPKAIGG